MKLLFFLIKITYFIRKIIFIRREEVFVMNKYEVTIKFEGEIYTGAVFGDSRADAVHTFKHALLRKFTPDRTIPLVTMDCVRL